jgi:hypothetical protein
MKMPMTAQIKLNTSNSIHAFDLGICKRLVSLVMMNLQCVKKFCQSDIYPCRIREAFQPRKPSGT